MKSTLARLFAALRVLVDRPQNRSALPDPGRASPTIIKNVSETLAGRVEFIEMAPFGLSEVGVEHWRHYGCGRFSRAFLAESDEDSAAWREGFIRTFLELVSPTRRRHSATAMRRLDHVGSLSWADMERIRIGAIQGLSDKTVRSYLDLLTGAFMVRPLQPWHINIGKRQVRAPKIYLRGTGLLHGLLSLPDWSSVLGHPCKRSWEASQSNKPCR
ncbi:DUF4143 domain-containing protein [Candidatus Amarolinea dominans]|uniref:DUF4143 domain-containing protein n=1 Tax=Candidatus Amarolinea dominans TaxID=3140696 RepID=UPI00313523B7|nr:ATP-binding protein [Anaerolineae bacterium]